MTKKNLLKKTKACQNYQNLSEGEKKLDYGRN